MSLVVGTNTSALYSQNALKSNARLTATAMERLSTGLRVGSAKDDAAGLAISQNMTSQIRGLNQAVRNINDGINLLQTAEGGLGAISSMLQRMRELAVQSSNGTLSGSDRLALNSEFTSLRGEAVKIKNNSIWNGINLLDGSFDNDLQTGSYAGETSRVTIPQIILPGIQNNSKNTITTKGSGVLHGTPIGTQDYTTVVDIDTTSYSSGGTITIVIQLGNGSSGASYDLYKNAITTNVHPINSLANAYDVGPGSTVNLSYTFAASPSDHYILGFEGNWFSSPQSTNTFNYSITVSDQVVPPPCSITTQLNAVNSLNQIDQSLASVNNAQATIGSYVNSLTYTADNATNISSNLAASRSTITDADYAVESTNLARTQIIQEAATAMLAQANQQPQAVLSLLKNL